MSRKDKNIVEFQMLIILQFWKILEKYYNKNFILFWQISNLEISRFFSGGFQKSEFFLQIFDI